MREGGWLAAFAGAWLVAVPLGAQAPEGEAGPVTRAAPPVTRASVPQGMWEIRVAAGARHEVVRPGLGFSGSEDDLAFAFDLQLTHGFTAALQWVVPTLAFAYRVQGEPDLEWIPWGGLLRWGFGSSSVEGLILSGDIGAGLDLRWSATEHEALIASVGVRSDFRWVSDDALDSRYPPATWRASYRLGMSHTLEDVVTVSPGIVIHHRFLVDGGGPDGFDEHGLRRGNSHRSDTRGCLSHSRLGW